jgi:hypothetical protein
MTTEKSDAVPVLQDAAPTVDATHDEGKNIMTLGDRCDEIVRLIDETLMSVATYITGESDDHVEDREVGYREDDEIEGVRLIDGPRAGSPRAGLGHRSATGHPNATGRAAHPSGSALAGPRPRRLAVVAGGRRRGPSHTIG